MCFFIQLGHLKIIRKSTANEGVELLNLFSKAEESLYLYYHDIPIRFRYKYDLLENTESIAAMCQQLLWKETGEISVYLHHQFIHINWSLNWSGEKIDIQAKYRAKYSLYTDYAASQQRKGNIATGKEEFLREWKSVISQLIRIQEAIGDSLLILDIDQWKYLESQIPYYGILYTRSE